jgi:hypothetical protein
MQWFRKPEFSVDCGLSFHLLKKFLHKNVCNRIKTYIGITLAEIFQG